MIIVLHIQKEVHHSSKKQNKQEQNLTRERKRCAASRLPKKATTEKET